MGAPPCGYVHNTPIYTQPRVAREYLTSARTNVDASVAIYSPLARLLDKIVTPHACRVQHAKPPFC